MSDSGPTAIFGPTARKLPASIGGYRSSIASARARWAWSTARFDDKNGRAVALKVMMADLEGDNETRERF